MEIEISGRPKAWYAWQMKIAGVSSEVIAERLGYKNAHTVDSTITRYRTEQVGKLSVQTLIDIEVDRLDLLALTFWRKAQTGDEKAASVVLACGKQKASLLGIEKKPEGSGGTQITQNAIFIGGTEQDFIKQLQQAREVA